MSYNSQFYEIHLTNMKKQCCETCRYYGEEDVDRFHAGRYQAVFTNWCDMHEETMTKYWSDKCKDWEEKTAKDLEE